MDSLNSLNIKMKTFKPIVLYGSSNTPDTISQTDLLHQQTLIEEHRVKTRNMLDYNARLWESEASLGQSAPSSFDQQNAHNSSAHFVNPPVETNRALSSHQRRDYLPKTIKLNFSGINSLEPQLYNHEVFTLDDVSLSPSSSRRSSNFIGKSEEEEEYFDDEDECHTNTTTFITEPQFHPTYKPNISRKRRRGNLPKKVTEFLKRWLILHKKHPYPTEREKQILADETGLMVNQISNWFINARRRILQPLLESENKQSMLTSESSSSLSLNGVNVVGGTNSNSRNNPVAESSNYQPHHHHNYNNNSTSSGSNLLLNEPTEDDQTTERVPKYSAPPPWVLLPTKLPSMNILEKDLGAFDTKK